MGGQSNYVKSSQCRTIASIKATSAKTEFFKNNKSIENNKTENYEETFISALFINVFGSACVCEL